MASRRIVTGKDANGRSVIVHDDPPAPAGPSGAPESLLESQRIWATDATSPDLNGDDPIESGVPTAFEAPLGTVSWNLYTFLPGFGAVGEGWHTTPSIDFVAVLSGEVILSLDDGEIRLTAGDCIVQRGTQHAWRNVGDEPCVISVAIIKTS